MTLLTIAIACWLPFSLLALKGGWLCILTPCCTDFWRCLMQVLRFSPPRKPFYCDFHTEFQQVCRPLRIPWKLMNGGGHKKNLFKIRIRPFGRPISWELPKFALKGTAAIWCSVSNLCMEVKQIILKRILLQNRTELFFFYMLMSPCYGLKLLCGPYSICTNRHTM